MIELRPLDLAQANEAVRLWHRHHKPVVGHKFSVGAYVEGELAGAVIVGRPVAAALNNGVTWEVTRLACDQRERERESMGHANSVASRLLGSAWRASSAVGVRRLISYTRVDEDGTCYRAAGWVATSLVEGAAWTGGNKSMRWLPGLYVPSTEIVDRVRWEIGPDSATTRVRRDQDGAWREIGKAAA